MKNPGIVGELARSYCKKFPFTSNLQLARMLRRDTPEVFKDIDSARNAVRYCRGVSGSANRNCVRSTGKIVPRLVIPPAEPSDWRVYDLPGGVSRWLLLYDIHVPYHDPADLRTAIAFGKQRDMRCDGVIYGGDLLDFYQLSHWVKDPRRRHPKEEVEAVKTLMASIRGYLKPKHEVWLEANHEYRLQRYLRERAPELYEMPGWSIPDWFHLEEEGLLWVPHGSPLRHRNLTILHGDEWQGGMTSPVNPARSAFLKGVECMIVGHQHRTSEHTETTVSGTTITCWSVGCLCDLHPEYARLNRWNRGFAVLETKGNWRIHNFRIVNGEVV